MSLGTRIRARRENLGYTQKELGIKVNVTEQLISLWELDKRSPSVEKLAELSNILGVTTDYIIKGEGLGATCDLELSIRSNNSLTHEAKETLLKVANLFMKVKE
jgi:transcriptional regulator with XRE-family HTH domain